MGHNFSVGLSSERNALGFEFDFEFIEIFDDAVVNDYNIARNVGMGVGFVRHAMGGPTGMTNAGEAIEW